MDELESRLSDGLARHAAGVPAYDGDVRRVTRRGRNRRWATRGAGAVGALAILGGGAVIYQAAGGDETENLATQTPPVIVAPAETPTPTAEPSPEPDTTPEAATTPEPAATPADETVVRDVFAATANGWGVGLVGTGGDLFATLSCCDEVGEDWRAQPLADAARGALRVRDDLRGGLVVSTADTLWLQPAGTIGDDTDPIVVDRAPVRETTPVTVELWDVALLGDTVQVLYSVSVSDPLGVEGRDELRQALVGPDGVPRVDTLGEASTWSAAEPGFIRTGAAWVAGGGHMELRKSIGGDGPDCEWVVYVETDPSFDSPFDPPTAGGECPQVSIGAAAMNADGQLAVIERFLAAPPLTADLVVYDQVGNELHRYPLPETVEGAPRWTELDIVGSSVLVSRELSDLQRLDAVLRFDLGSSSNPRELTFVGNPTFARSDIVTSGLTPLFPDDDRWFGKAAVVPEPTPDPDDPTDTEDQTDAEEPETTPDPAEPTPAVVRDEYREPVGRDVNVVPADAFGGTDGCFDDGEAICLGAPIADALEVAERLWGPERSDSPEALREGEPPPANEFVYFGANWDVHITERDGVVGEIRAWPGSEGFGTAVFVEAIEKLGPPADLFLGGGEGSDVLWVFYDSPAAYVGYGYLESWGVDEPVLVEDVSDGFPAVYDSLGINSIWIRPAGAG
ncbi:MAG: hypothetical protein AAF480_15675 [Actinomycetota bacterium]